MKKILLVTPDGNSLAGYRNILEREEVRVFTAATYEEGLRIHREEEVNLVLTELDLPDMGGDVLCYRIRQEQSLSKVSVIVVCGDTPEEMERAESCGANARLVKPVEPEELDGCVRKLLAVSPRQECRVLVRAQVYGEHGATTLFGTSRNISVSGLLISSDALLAVGDRISCMFFLPGQIRIAGVAEVVRANRLSRIMKEYGVRFVSLYPQAQAEIENFVAVNQAA
jgi:DNA-binding response OmpR family regulator